MDCFELSSQSRIPWKVLVVYFGSAVDFSRGSLGETMGELCQNGLHCRRDLGKSSIRESLAVLWLERVVVVLG